MNIRITQFMSKGPFGTQVSQGFVFSIKPKQNKTTPALSGRIMFKEHLIPGVLSQYFPLGVGEQQLDSQRNKSLPTPVLLPGKFHGLMSLVGYSPWGHKESDTTERLHFQHMETKLGEKQICLILAVKMFDSWV